VLLVVHHAFHSTTSRGLTLAEIGHHRPPDSPFAGRGQTGRITQAGVIARPRGKARVAVAVIASSARLAADVRAAMLTGTTMPVSNYDGKNGTKLRDDLAGLNLTTVPKILIEVGNMKNPADAKMLTSAAFQQPVAEVLLRAILMFLR
jgi:N-acetylmuramoyl-L-alanine amidase